MNILIENINTLNVLDNVKENREFCEQFCLEAKASLLIEANATSGRWKAFMPGDEFTCKDRKMELARGDTYYGQVLDWSKPAPGCACQSALKMELKGSIQIREGQNIFPLTQECIASLQEIYDLPDTEHFLRMAALAAYGSACKAAQSFSRCQSVEAICQYWGHTPHPYAVLHNIREMFFDPFRGEENINFSKLQPMLPEGFLPGNITPWDNESGETMMQIVTILTPDGEKFHIPVSQWFRHGSGVPMLFATPVSDADKLPLYQLPKLRECSERSVVVTDSIELAAANRKDENAIWTTWIGDFRASDWSVLREAEEVFLLVINHSGKKLEEAYREVDALKSFLMEEVKLANLKFLQVAMEYSDEGSYALQDSFQKMELSEFEQMCSKAYEALEPKSPFWYEAPLAGSSNDRTAKLLNAKLVPYQYLLRNFIIKNSVTLIHAEKGIGKSMLAYSIAVAIAANKRIDLCPGMWWVTPKAKQNVLYLDFENNESQIGNRLRKICQAYKVNPESIRKNLVIRDGSQLPPANYAAKEQHGIVLKWLDEAEEELGGHIDLIILDPYSRFVNSNENTRTVAAFTDLCNKITARGTAILVVHHSNEKGDVRGFREKRDQASCVISLQRGKGGAALDLNEAPLTVRWESMREPDYHPEQQIRLENGMWHPVGVDDVEKLEQENFDKIVDYYKGCGFIDKDIQAMLQISNGNFYRKRL